MRSFDVRPSERFALPDGATREVIQVRPTSQTAFGGGLLLAALGGAALSLAAIWYFANGFAEADSTSAKMTGPFVTALSGGVAVVSGLILVGLNSSTRVSQSQR